MILCQDVLPDAIDPRRWLGAHRNDKYWESKMPLPLKDYLLAKYEYTLRLTVEFVDYGE